MKTLFRFTTLILCGALFSCNHLLYPAERQPFVLQKSLRPVPQDVYIPVFNELKNPNLHAWYFPAQSKVKKGLVVHFHGNGQNLTTHFLFMSWITDYGYDYLIFDYRGYGASSDESASQQKTVEDGLAVFRYLSDNFKGTPIIAFGQSLGSNVLVRTLQELSKKNQKALLPALVVLDSSFLSYHAAASSVLGQRWFLYPLKPFVYFLLSDEWSAENELNQTPPLPALFFHGTADPTINYELGMENFKLWPGPKVFSSQQGGSHTSAFSDTRFVDSRAILLHCAELALKDPVQIEQCLK